MPAPIEEALGYRFRNSGLLREALTHKSFAFEKEGGRHNERLEFLGDSILAAVVADHLFASFPEQDEGRLSKMKARLVSRAKMAEWAQGIGLGGHVLLGSGEDSTGGRARPSILANSLEALIGAIYVDGGYLEASRFIHRCFLDASEEFVETDHKSRLQELVQKRHKVPPSYTLLETSGPDHDKTFRVRVMLGARTLGLGSGKTKKDAEQAAALAALEEMARREPGRGRDQGD